MPNEPQSYGSQGEWVTGRTGQEVNRQKGEPAAGHADFYDGRRDSETSGEHQGGEVSEVQARDNAQSEKGSTDDEITAVKNVTRQETGAKRSSFFKDRDYGA